MIVVVIKLQIFESYLPEVQHVKQDRDLHQIDSAANVVIPEHHQMATQLQARLLYQVSLPVTLEDLEQVASVNVRGVLGDQFTQDYSTVSLKQENVRCFTII